MHMCNGFGGQGMLGLGDSWCVCVVRGDSHGPPGDSRGTRWGFSGDSLPFWGTRSESAIIFAVLQGDSPETTFGFYNIKRGFVVMGGGMWAF